MTNVLLINDLESELIGMGPILYPDIPPIIYTLIYFYPLSPGMVGALRAAEELKQQLNEHAVKMTTQATTSTEAETTTASTEATTTEASKKGKNAKKAAPDQKKDVAQAPYTLHDTDVPAPIGRWAQQRPHVEKAEAKAKKEAELKAAREAEELAAKKAAEAAEDLAAKKAAEELAAKPASAPPPHPMCLYLYI